MNPLERTCEGCGNTMRPRVWSNGVKESPSVFITRKHCSKICVKLAYETRRLARTTKPCGKCGIIKPIESFHPAHTGRKGSRQSWCRDCLRAYGREWMRSDKGRAARLRRNRKDLYGITESEYQALHEAQASLCAICGRPEWFPGARKDGKPISLSVDHDHVSGDIRGLLCKRCNQAVGQFEDSSLLLRAAADYLDRTPAIKR